MNIYSSTLVLALLLTNAAHAGRGDPICLNIGNQVKKIVDDTPITAAVYKEVKIDPSAITEIPHDLKDGLAIESPVMNADGTKVAYVGNHLNEGKITSPADLYVKKLTGVDEPAAIIHKKPYQLMNIFVKGSFLPDGADLVACELDYRPGALTKSVINAAEHQWSFDNPQGYHSVISFYHDGVKTSALTAKDFVINGNALPKNTFLEHPRITNDGKWLTFYIQSNPKSDGVYVYNRTSKKTFYMGQYEDKHPTFSKDGKKIFFHEEGKLITTGDELARVGYYDVNYTTDPKTGEQIASMGARHILGDTDAKMGSKYIYMKHPAYHEGLNAVFFHAQQSADGGKSIGMISLDHPNDPVYFKMSHLDSTGAEIKVTHAEHADASFQPDSPIVFVGRDSATKLPKQKSDKLLKIDFSALKAAYDQLMAGTLVDKVKKAKED